MKVNVSALPAEAADEKILKRLVALAAGVPVNKISGYHITRRSIDARGKQARIIMQADVYINEKVPVPVPFDPQLQHVAQAKPVIIVGAGPAGLFAALRLISLGLKPIIVERGKDVRSRRRDLAAMNKEGIVNPESNYCFGEGGAGTYSDGKLYTRSTKRGDVKRILELFHYFGADESILYDAHPHIGTNKLPQIISAMRHQIIECGGEVLFQEKVIDLLLDGNIIKGIRTASGTTIKADAVILATGHSARDIFELLHHKGIAIEAKPFALGVRIEHPQQLVDQAQYHTLTRDPLLPPASYSLVTQAMGRGVFSFCMCPGGIIAPAATAPGEIVVNGWSPSKRNNPYANSGTVVSVDERDFATYGFKGQLAAMQYQRMVEQKAYAAFADGLIAPAQRLTDFVNGKISSTLPDCSYLPGIKSADMKSVLPKEVYAALKQGVVDFGKKMKGYYTENAVLVATESRTSSPVRIPRHKDTLQHVQVKGLFPCAEGAGYAGGIVSAGIDGENCALMANIFLR